MGFDIQSNYLIQARNPDLKAVKKKKHCQVIGFVLPANDKGKIKETGEKKCQDLDLEMYQIRNC